MHSIPVPQSRHRLPIWRASPKHKILILRIVWVLAAGGLGPVRKNFLPSNVIIGQNAVSRVLSFSAQTTKPDLHQLLQHVNNQVSEATG